MSSMANTATAADPATSIVASTSNAGGKSASRMNGASSTAVADGPTDTALVAAQILDLGQLHFDPHMSFLTTNRVVAVLEKAVERLQLLTLLDTTCPAALDEEAAAAAAAEATRMAEADSIASNMLGTKRVGTTRGAATFEGPQGQLLRKTAPAVTAALMATANVQRRGRPTVAELLAEQRVLEARYGELLQATKKVRPRGTEPVLDHQCFSHIKNPEQAALLHELKVVSAKLRDHNKVLCTQLKDNPNDADNWNKISNERRELIHLLQSTVAELTTGYQESKRGGSDTAPLTSAASVGQHGNMAAILRTASCHSMSPGAEQSAADGSQAPPIMKGFGTMQSIRTAKAAAPLPRIPLISSYERFARKILQEQAAQRWADDLVRKERELNQNVKQLQSDLMMERSMKEKELAERRARINQLRIQLRDLKRRLKERSDEAKAQVEAATEGLQRQAADEDRIVTMEMNRQQHLVQVENRTFELFANHLKERAQVMDDKAADWDRKNQREIKKMESEKIDAEQTRQMYADRLAEFEREDVSQKELKVERDTKKHTEEEEATNLENKKSEQYTSASTIESAIKSLFTRMALVKLKKQWKKKQKKLAAAAKAAAEAEAKGKNKGRR